MEKANKKSLLILITNPFAVLNVIHSGLAADLEKKFRISIISDFLSETDIRYLNSHFQLQMVLLKRPLPRVSWLEDWLRSCQMLAFAHAMNLGTVHIKLMERSRTAGWLFGVSQQFPVVRMISGWLAATMRDWLIRHKNCQGCDADWNFSAVLSTSPLDIRENRLSTALISRNIPCISLVISWDNLSSKGVMNVNSKLVLVWSDAMAHEYERLYGLFRNSTIIRTCGLPRFDIYFKEPVPASCLSRWKEELGIDLSARVILFCTGAVKHHACQNYIIDDLLEYAATQGNLALVIRCHPGDDPDRYKRYGRLKNIHFFQPFSGQTGHVSCPPANFPDILKLHLSVCDVCVQVASTMYLDASACNKPTISIAYDAQRNTPYTKSVRRFYDYSHQLSIRQLPHQLIVRDRQALFEKLDEILHGQRPLPDFRENIRPIIYQCSPDAVRIAAQHIRECSL